MTTEQENGTGISLLYVEDDVDARELISEILVMQYQGLRLLVAADGAQGVELYRKYLPEIVLTDIKMPVMDGLRMATAIRQVNAEACLIAVTAHSDSDCLLDAIEIGFNHYLLKPLNCRKLFMVLDAGITAIRQKQTLKAQKKQLQQGKEELEQRVVDRTQELVMANDHLRQEIAERQRAEVELLQAMEAAEAANRAKSRFLTNMSHELRTPMNGVLGMIQLVQYGELDDNQREYLDLAQRSGEALVRILNDILDLTSIEKRQLSVQTEPFPLLTCVTDTLEMLNPEALRKGVRMTVSVDAAVPATIIGDHVRLQQVLSNLIGNAIKFTEQGKVEVRVTSDPQGVTFSVEDTGIGIPPDKKELLFKQFSQIDDSNTRRYGGTGLGLVLSKEIVELMGGTISLESVEGEGSTFSFTLPYVTPVLQSPEVTPAVAGSIATGRKTEPPRILVVEDDYTNRTLLHLSLNMKNYHVETATNGRQAVEMWERGPYDLIIMDVQMPIMDGIAATRAIRTKEQERGGHTPILAMTAHAYIADKSWCLDAGMDNYVAKPVDFTNLHEVVAKYL